MTTHRRPRLRTPEDQRMQELVSAANVFVTEKNLAKLTRENFPVWVDKLKIAEASTRRLRKRLEALQAGDEKKCPMCGRPVTGRPDAAYCSTYCRVRAHRARKSVDS